MPNSIVKSFASKTEKPVDEVEKLWGKAKEAAKSQGKKESDPDFFAYVTGTLKKMLKMEGKCLLSYKEYVNEINIKQE